MAAFANSQTLSGAAQSTINSIVSLATGAKVWSQDNSTEEAKTSDASATRMKSSREPSNPMPIYGASGRGTGTIELGPLQ